MSMSSHTLIRFIIAILLAGACSAQPKKLPKDLESGVAAEEDINLIVRFKARSSEVAKGKEKLAQLGAILRDDLPVINGTAVTLKGKHLGQLNDSSSIEYITRDRVVTPLMDFTRATLNAEVLPSPTLNGAGIGVAVLDSGISDVPDLKGRIVYKRSFTPNGTNDVYGHGSMVAGIIGGSGKDSGGKYRGLAPGVSLLNLKVLADNGTGLDSYVIAAIQKAIELKKTYNIRVMNLSVGREIVDTYSNDPLCLAVQAAWKAGIVVVVAAGNDGRSNKWENQGYGTIKSPGNDPFVITVGAMKSMGTPSRADDRIASYSSKGPTLIDQFAKPDLVAPGNRIVTTGGAKITRLEKQYPQNIIGNSYFRMSGTSLAAPAVSAAVALMIQKDPSLTPDQVKARLLRTASKSFPMYSTAIDQGGATYTSQYDIFTIGAGYLDVTAALNDTIKSAGLALTPKAVFDSNSGKVYVWLNWYAGLPDYQTGSVAGAMPEGTTVVWGSSLVWGTSIVWGTNVWVDGTSICWGTGIVWGTGSTSGTSIVWGATSPHTVGSSVASETDLIAVGGEN
jgi:serine protease AprX